MGDAGSGAHLSVERAPIMGGTPATDYPEAVTMNLCSGVVIAPSVVMTASHCIGSAMGVRQGNFQVSAPNAAAVTAHGSSAWGVGYVTGNAKHLDVALVFLDAPITLSCYPTLASTEIPFPTMVVDVGRTMDGSLTDSLWVSKAIPIGNSADDLGLADHYESTEDLTEDGDSGGPIELADGSHTIVAVTSTDTVELGLDAGAPLDLFARVDTQFADIDAMVKAHGGYGAPCGLASSGGSAGAAGADAGTEDASSGASAGAGGSGGATSTMMSEPAQGSGGCEVASRGASPALFVWALVACAARGRRRREASVSSDGRA
jgi:hypothetical protein